MFCKCHNFVRPAIKIFLIKNDKITSSYHARTLSMFSKLIRPKKPTIKSTSYHTPTRRLIQTEKKERIVEIIKNLSPVLRIQRRRIPAAGAGAPLPRSASGVCEACGGCGACEASAACGTRSPGCCCHRPCFASPGRATSRSRRPWLPASPGLLRKKDLY